MNARYWISFIMIVALGILGTQAQDVLTLPDGATVQVLDGWEVIEETSDLAQMANDDIGMLITFYVYAPEFMEENRLRSLADLAEYDYSLYDIAEDNPFDERDLEDSEVANLAAVEYAFSFQNVDDNQERDAITVYFITEDGTGYASEVSELIGGRLSMNDAYDVLNTFTQEERNNNSSGSSPDFSNALQELGQGNSNNNNASAECEIEVSIGTNLRSEPSVTAEVVRQVNGEEVLLADYAIEDSRGNRWFHVVEDDAFVREDIVFFDEDTCTALELR
jgi:hypothetical protein